MAGESSRRPRTSYGSTTCASASPTAAIRSGCPSGRSSTRSAPRSSGRTTAALEIQSTSPSARSSRWCSSVPSPPRPPQTTKPCGRAGTAGRHGGRAGRTADKPAPAYEPIVRVLIANVGPGMRTARGRAAVGRDGGRRPSIVAVVGPSESRPTTADDDRGARRRRTPHPSPPPSVPTPWSTRAGSTSRSPRRTGDRPRWRPPTPSELVTAGRCLSERPAVAPCPHLPLRRPGGPLQPEPRRGPHGPRFAARGFPVETVTFTPGGPGPGAAAATAGRTTRRRRRRRLRLRRGRPVRGAGHSRTSRRSSTASATGAGTGRRSSWPATTSPATWPIGTSAGPTVPFRSGTCPSRWRRSCSGRCRWRRSTSTRGCNPCSRTRTPTAAARSTGTPR